MNEHPPLPSLIDLPEPLRPAPRFLQPGATTDQLIRASAANHLEWFGNDLRYENGLRWKEGVIAFPKMPARVASEQLDTIVAHHRALPPKEITCWSLSPTTPRDLGARLVARGFDWGWRPHWMAADLHALRCDFPVPDGLRIAVENDVEWDVDDLPFYTRPSKDDPPVPTSGGPLRRWRFGARLNGKLVGQTVLHVNTGPLGIGGIYNVGVVPAARNQGVGRAVMLAACQFARALGCHYALLNAATHIYERVGFVSLGYGQTWFLHPETLSAPPPTPAQVAYFEAIGRRSRSALDRLRREEPDVELDAPLASGMTLMALATRMGLPENVRWLMAQGAILDVIHAWDLGWKDEARRLLTARPELANRQVGRMGLTPLHEASNRNDPELARLALTAKPDLTIRDRQYNGIPHDWARVLGRPEILRLIEEHS